MTFEERTPHLREYGFGTLIALGMLAAFFFSSTFVLNRFFSVGGGHWFWTAFLRYFFVLILLFALIPAKSGFGRLKEASVCLVNNLGFWISAGSIGFGLFYSALSFAASFAQGWIVATTWQTTIMATIVVLWAFGQTVNRASVFFVVLVFGGVLLTNSGHIETFEVKTMTGILAVFLAAFCYPIGNTLVKFAKDGRHPRVRRIQSVAMDDVFCLIWMMTCGAMPFFGILWIVVQPPGPTVAQLWGTSFIAISTGVVATGLFLTARQHAVGDSQTAGVDATQAGEVPFALAIEILVFGGGLPSFTSVAGVFLVVLGIAAAPIYAAYCTLAESENGGMD